MPSSCKASVNTDKTMIGIANKSKPTSTTNGVGTNSSNENSATGRYGPLQGRNSGRMKLRESPFKKKNQQLKDNIAASGT